MSKYHNRKTKVDGITFDSAKEARRYCELKLLLWAGEIRDLELQKEFVLIPQQSEVYARYGKNGRRLKDGVRVAEKPVKYVADFCYATKDGAYIVEDTKGMRTRTPDYIIKRKLMLWVHKIKIKET